MILTASIVFLIAFGGSCLPLRASVPSDTCPRAFRYAPSCLPIRASRRHFHAAICYFLIRDCHLHVSNCHLHVSNSNLHVSKCHFHVIDGHLRVVQPYDNQCERFLLGLDGNGERRRCIGGYAVFSLGRAGDKLENPKKKLKFSNKNCKFFRKTDYFCGHIGTTLLLFTIFKCYSL